MASVGGGINPSKLFVDSDLSERYAQHRPSLPLEHVETIVNKLLKRRPRLWVDVGCGPGTSTQQLIGYSDKILGVDISETQIEVAKKNIQHDTVTFVTGSCDALPVPDASVDVITAIQAAHYFDLPAFFKEVERCLVPGGYLCLAGFYIPIVKDNEIFSKALRDFICVYLRPYFHDVTYYYLEVEYDTMIPPYNDTRQKMVVEVPVPSSYADVLGLMSSYSPTCRIMAEEGISKEAVVEGYEKELTKHGVTEEMKASQHVVLHECFMVTVQKPM